MPPRKKLGENPTNSATVSADVSDVQAEVSDLKKVVYDLKEKFDSLTSDDVDYLEARKVATKVDRQILLLGMLFSTQAGFLSNPHRRLADGFSASNEKHAREELRNIFEIALQAVSFFETMLQEE